MKYIKTKSKKQYQGQLLLNDNTWGVNSASDDKTILIEHVEVEGIHFDRKVRVIDSANDDIVWHN
ncbi:MAG: hypothetical protein GQ474_08025 [Sulfurimonas sp.]|nr:hypothetical protein [Sulfurimonas sp.]